MLNHINDTERVFVFRAFWFGRGFITAGHVAHHVAILHERYL